MCLINASIKEHAHIHTPLPHVATLKKIDENFKQVTYAPGEDSVDPSNMLQHLVKYQ